MKINTAKLRALVDEALAQDRAAWDKEEADFAARQVEHREKWSADYSEAWAETVKKITAALKKGQPVTGDLFPRANGASRSAYYLSDIAVYTPLAPSSRHEKQIVSGKAEYQTPQSLLRFRAVLDLIEDDTLTTSALKEHGLANLEQRLLQYINLAAER